MLSKFGKEKTLFKDEYFRVKYGTIDALKLNAIYINVESWVQPMELTNFDNKIRLIRSSILSKLNKTIDTELFSNDVIVDLDLRSSGLMLNKKSFMSIEITIYPQKRVKFNSEIIKTHIKDIAQNTINVLVTNNFKYNSKKK